MEKTKCPKCGTIMLEEYEKPALNLTCPKCGCKMATTRWEEIDLDPIDYEIVIMPNNNPQNEQIKFISKQIGDNFINSKKFLMKGGLYYKGNAKATKEKKVDLSDLKIDYVITPDFKY